MNWLTKLVYYFVTPKRDETHCSFCLKSRNVGGPLVEGPRKVFVCDACIDLNRLIMAQAKRRLGLIPPIEDEFPHNALANACSSFPTINSLSEESAMTDAPKRTIWPIAIATLVLLPLLYALSVGPVYWAYGHGYLGINVLKSILGPLREVFAFCGLQEWLQWYVNLWYNPPA